MSDKRIEILKDLGFPSYPARAYIALRDDGPSTARSLAETANVPVGKIYSALRYLMERKLVEEPGGRPQRYVAAGIHHHLNAQRERLDIALREVEGIDPAQDAPLPPAVFRSLLARVQQPVIVGEIDGAIGSWNGAASRLFSYAEDEARHMRLQALFPPDLRSKLGDLLKLLERAPPDGSSEITAELETLTRRGERIAARIELLAVPSDARSPPRGAMLIDPIDARHVRGSQISDRGQGFAVVRGGELLHIDAAFLEIIGDASEAPVPIPGEQWAPRRELHRAFASVLRELNANRPAPERFAGAIAGSGGRPIRVELAVRPAALAGGSVLLVVDKPRLA